MKFKKLRHFVLASSIAAFLSGCGGGGAGGGGTVTVPPTPAPTPTPSPTPTPAATFAVVAGGAMLSNVWLDVNGNGQFGNAGDGATSTSLTGTFGRDVIVARPAQVSGTIPTSPLYRMQALGVDAVTGFGFGEMTAPVGATIISPLSSLIDAHGNAATVRNALGLAAGPTALRSDTNLITFNPVEGRRSSDASIANDAARLTSVNLQLLALAAIAKDTNGDPIDINVSLRESSRYLAEVINSAGTANLSDKAVILAVLKKSRSAVGMPDAALDAAAALLAKYFAAIPERLSDDASIRAWAYAYRFYVLAEAKALLSQWPNPATARIVAITQTDIQASAQSFATATAPMMTDFIALADYRELTPLTSYSITMTGCSIIPYSPICNDWTLFFGAEQNASITAVATGNPSALSVSLAATGEVTISRVGTFTGLTHFTYTARTPSGLTSSGVVYVRVRDAP